MTITPTLARHKGAGPRGGPAPVRLRLSDRRQDLYISLDLRVRPSDWNARTGRVRKTHALADEMNELIALRVENAERARLKVMRAGAVPTARAVKDALTGTAEAGDFLSHARDYLDRVEAGGNVQRARGERAVLDKLAAFAGDPLPFHADNSGLGRALDGVAADREEQQGIDHRALREGAPCALAPGSRARHG